MAKMSVGQAAERLGVSPARVRQRIGAGTLVAEKIGGRWLVDLAVSSPAPLQAGRPVSPASVWWSLVASEIAKAALPSGQLAAIHQALEPARVAVQSAGAGAAAAAIREALKPALDSAAFERAALSATGSFAAGKAVAAVDADAGHALKPLSDAVAARLRAMEPVRDLAAQRRALLSRMRIAEAVLADLEPDVEKPAAAGDGDVLEDFVSEAQRLSRSSRNRAVHRLAEAVESRDHDSLLAWLSNRSSRRLFVAAPSDLNALREDQRLVPSGLSDPRSGMDDLRLLEGYVKADDVDAIASDYWLELPGIDDRPNVVLHVSPVRPPAIGPMLLAADLAEHGGPRELVRAHELLDEAIDALVPTGDHGTPS
ncbi:MAG: helix-turn-helix domain-containing protein [Knoellia sp.]